jgi:nucleoside-diphosphate-sugar epimerase
MRLLVLGGTHFLGRHVVSAAVARGHEVATFTRGVSGAPPEGVRALHGDRDDPAALPAALRAWPPELNAYRNRPPGPIRGEDDATWNTTERGYGPDKAYAERVLGAALGDRFLTARAGLIVGPYDPLYRLGWWLNRIAAGGRVVVPADGLAQPIALIDARDLASWLVEAVEAGLSGAVNATGPAGMTTLGGLLDTCREVTDSDAEWVPVGDAELLAAGVHEWVHLPMWVRAEQATTLWDVVVAGARPRPAGEHGHHDADEVVRVRRR